MPVIQWHWGHGTQVPFPGFHPSLLKAHTSLHWAEVPNVTVLMMVPQDQEQVTAVLLVFMRFKTLWQVIKQLMICLLVPLIVV